MSNFDTSKEDDMDEITAAMGRLEGELRKARDEGSTVDTDQLDIVERLRREPDEYDPCPPELAKLVNDAADYIESLRSRPRSA